MRPDTLRNILLATLASTSVGGLAACSACTTEAESSPIQVSPRTFPISVTTPDYTMTPRWSSADVSAYLAYLHAVAAEPCEQFCSQNPEVQGTFESCSTSMSTYYDDAGTISPYDPVPPPGLPAITVTCQTTVQSCGDPVSFGGGRRFAGFVTRPIARGSDARGEFFAALAQLEAASVSAFAIVARDLARHGAPRRLVRAALRARSDEERHVRIASRLARRFGARADVAVEAPPWTARSLESIARENAVEGCVRETYGALVAWWTAGHARDALVRGAVGAIARDETRHAALAWQIAAWASRRLSPRERLHVARARERAVTQLARELETPPAAVLVRDRILPAAPLGLALLDSVERFISISSPVRSLGRRGGESGLRPPGAGSCPRRPRAAGRGAPSPPPSGRMPLACGRTSRAWEAPG
jgi:hypothetical protein